MLLALVAAPGAFADAALPQRRWYEAAEAMRRLALSWGDQPYGAVVVQDRALFDIATLCLVRGGRRPGRDRPDDPRRRHA